MVDAIISAVVEDLTSMLLSSIKEEVKLVTGVNDEVKKLVNNLKSIQALLDDAEEQQLKEASVKNWLFNLKAVSYDTDDVIDEWKTWIQTSQFQNQHHSSGSSQSQLKHKVLYIFRCICFIKRDVSLRHVVARKIREFQQRLDDIATDQVRYQFSSSQKTDKHIERHVTTSYIDTQEVKGRDQEKDKVKSMILNAKSKFHIVSLVGMGGIGKTTLAQLVYNDREIQTHFDNKIWVCISESFDEMRIAKAILESIDGSFIYDLKELENVLTKIRGILREKRFLLVLDDVWNENPTKWKELKQSLTCGLFGSTILITTRKEKVALVMGCRDESIYRVGLLNSDQCWSIISQIALVQGDRQKLENIGRRIADKCKGLPLAATTIGGLLRFKKSKKEWLKVMEQKEWEGEDGLDSLKLSYYDLPLSLKQCFKYCAIFPKDSRISKRRLIGMWMAQGYLKKEEKDDDLEMIGETYFDNLIARSLLQISKFNDSIYMLHDMVSDLAQTFTKNECIMIEVLKDTELNGNSLHADANVRHLTLTIENDASFPMSIYGLNKLRSLIIQFVRHGSSLTVVELEGIFDHLTCLRTLDLRGCNIKEIPSSINRLVHLRWLDLSDNKNMEKLPETLCECYNLQTLTLTQCTNMVELPQGIGKLINLMYLDITRCDKIKYLPKGIGNLWRLRELAEINISMNEGESFSIVEMEKLNNLRGRLKIRGLENVRKLEDVRKAQLVKKKNVTELRLCFDRDDVEEDEAELLEALEPPSDLEILSIESYEGKTFPSWMMNLTLLTKLKISNSRKCEELSPLGKLPCLKELYLERIRVKRVGVEFMGIEKEKDASTPFLSFPKLKILSFEQFWEWKEWDDIDEWLMKKINNKTITIMPHLQQLFINWCPKLKILPYHLLSPPITARIKVLDIQGCYVLEQEVQRDKLSHIPHFNIGLAFAPNPIIRFRAVRYLRSKLLSW
ncbi:hypothetical protein K2173_000911 [Erythroxylum novogranatense]|uniref:Uncharacterized protein n=1 Tax=Erythroxylum novogranatense TaxID=1862640 RepID=A0AAV8TQB7_9ROSI|nr:hypothetical protein K2173_000911 [Erythroxylum novogranatense]